MKCFIFFMDFAYYIPNLDTVVFCIACISLSPRKNKNYQGTQEKIL
jgi:hypothetical protein